LSKFILVFSINGVGLYFNTKSWTGSIGIPGNLWNHWILQCTHLLTIYRQFLSCWYLLQITATTNHSLGVFCKHDWSAQSVPVILFLTSLSR